MDSLLSIGAVARAAGISASALRYYDAEGLLAPSHVDEQTGYRFYDADQVETVALLARLRELGTSIADMRRVVDVQGEARAAVLEQLAAERRRALRAQVAGLKAEAAAARKAPHQVWAQVRADACLRALDTARLMCGDQSRQMVLYVSEHVRWLATDRYRLADIGVEGVCEGVSAVLLAPERVEAARAVLAAAGSREVSVVPGPDLILDKITIATESQQGKPDLARLAGLYSRAAQRRVPCPRPSADGGTVLVEVGDDQVRLNRELLLGACDALGGDDFDLRVDGPTDPVVLERRDAPAERIIIMPMTVR